MIASVSPCGDNHMKSLQKRVVGHADATRDTASMLPHGGTGEQRLLPAACDLVLPQPSVMFTSHKQNQCLFGCVLLLRIR